MFTQIRAYISSRWRQLWRRITPQEAVQDAVSVAAAAAANHLWMTGHAYRQFADAAETSYKLPGFAFFFRQLAREADTEAADMAKLVKTSPRSLQSPPPSPQAQEDSEGRSLADCLRAGRELEEENERQARELYGKQTAAAAADVGGAENWRQTARLAGTALTRLQMLVRHLNGISAAGVSIYVYDRLTMQQEVVMTAESTQHMEEDRPMAMQGDYAVCIPV
ncbi:unnamed protein product [Schistocephalus solidus]|nr:unnamed protein product [Schistocephalus solidus]